ncbi:DUF6602 domain-containing protein [Planctomyces sp. SH-PL62]|uniref:DUF6602 domain-containing protein n=1 Tax=Planctomyces sp. SH-PL62 TaxID=1636152 RepID=UPI00078DE43D|nr:DUF6602 domain-containing protein [Planctomyces sp. SH-PL62]AMV37108.1 hypothetical protein VT85_06730 [Planctomyces sp. SH-PL62]
MRDNQDPPDNEKFPRVQFIEYWHSLAQEILEARVKSRLIHATTNIDASGDEIEEAVRSAIRRKLPLRFHIGHGHIVDNRGNVSPQYDIIISDRDSHPILFETQNGTTYYTYESVYAIGEIKSTYYNAKKEIQKFCDNIRGMRSRLWRPRVPFHDSLSGERLKAATRNTVGIGYYDVTAFYGNPLFTFMFFVNANDFSPSQVASLYNLTPLSELPNVVCLLSEGLILNTYYFKRDDGTALPVHINSIPEFINTAPSPNVGYAWLLAKIGKAPHRAGGNLSMFMHNLFAHLISCKLSKPNLTHYTLNTMPDHEYEGISD